MSDERNNFPDEHRTADRPCGVELHKMAEQASDPATTEFYDIIGERERRSRVAGSGGNVVTFPHQRARQPGETTAFQTGVAAEKGRNILPLSWTRG